MDITNTFDFLPDNVRRRILQAVCGKTPESDPTGPHKKQIENQDVNNLPGTKPAGLLPKPLAPTSAECPTLPSLIAGACVVDDFILQSHVKTLLACAREALSQDSRVAALGGALPKQPSARHVDAQARGDIMRWLSPEEEEAAGRGPLVELLQRLQGLKGQLERQGYDVGGRPTFQLACYPGGGSRYVRHSDASLSCPNRTVTAIVYLNEEDWDVSAHGGALALYNMSYDGPLRGRGLEGGEPCTLVAPRGGRLLCFEAHVAHEVMPAWRHRFAVTVWFHRRPPPPPHALHGHLPPTPPPPRPPPTSPTTTTTTLTAVDDGAPPPPQPPPPPLDTLPHPPPLDISDTAVIVDSPPATPGPLQPGPEVSDTSATTPTPTPTNPPRPTPDQDLITTATTAAATSLAGAVGGATAWGAILSAEQIPAGAVAASSSSPARVPQETETAAGGISGEGVGDGGGGCGSHGMSGSGGGVVSCPPPPRIFVCLAAYRDPETAWTVHSVFSSATRPERVRVGIVWQVDPVQDADMVRVAGSRTHPEWLQRVRSIILPAHEATGPCKARALCQALWDGEEYVLQMDAHMRMMPGWDELCIQQLEAAESQSETGKVVLSTYPLGYSGEGAAASVPDPASAPATVLCGKDFDKDGVLRTLGRVLKTRPPAPLPAGFWAAGLSFARSPWIREVPYCPHLPHLFFGEEPYMLVRMWTRGWDVFAPATPLAFHQWERSARLHTYQRDGGGWEGGQQGAGTGAGRAVEQADTAAAGAGVTGTAVVGAGAIGGGCVTGTAGSIAALRRQSQARVLRVLRGHDGACGEEGEGMEGGGGTVLGPCKMGLDGLVGGGEEGWGVGQVWGLGTVRSLEQMAAVTGVDFRRGLLSERTRWGGLSGDAFRS